VRPADRDQSRWASARCSDGSPFSFQVRLSQTGTSNIWVILLEGGGGCDDARVSCANRQLGLITSKGSDRDYSPAFLVSLPGTPQRATGVLSLDPVANPVFSDANHVIAQHCSSDNFSGASSDLIPNSGSIDNVDGGGDGGPGPGWYFSRRLNIQAMFEILAQRYGLNDGNPNTKVLFIGQSAGGEGVLANAAQLGNVLPQPSPLVFKLLVQGGRLDLDDPLNRWGRCGLQIASRQGCTIFGKRR
jgi:hypothetical protein